MKSDYLAREIFSLRALLVVNPEPHLSAIPHNLDATE